jgi:putative endonuclease
MNNIQKGRLGEQIALNYLIDNNASILDTNYRINTGEIDIIAKLNEELVFIEVKSRSNTKFGYPSEAVNYNKIRKIINTAKYYILKNELNNIPIRFDVIEVYLKEDKINHIVNAF